MSDTPRWRAGRMKLGVVREPLMGEGLRDGDC